MLRNISNSCWTQYISSNRISITLYNVVQRCQMKISSIAKLSKPEFTRMETNFTWSINFNPFLILYPALGYRAQHAEFEPENGGINDMEYAVTFRLVLSHSIARSDLFGRMIRVNYFPFSGLTLSKWIIWSYEVSGALKCTFLGADVRWCNRVNSDVSYDLPRFQIKPFLVEIDTNKKI